MVDCPTLGLLGVMSVSVEHYNENTGNRDDGALAQQRRLIWGLVVWSTLLTLGLAASVTLQFIRGASVVPAEPQNLKNFKSTDDSKGPKELTKGSEDNLITFEPDWGHTTEVEILKWKTMSPKFLSEQKQLTVPEDGLYFLYLQVTLESPKLDTVYNVMVKSDMDNLVSSQINQTNPSTGLMGKGIALNKGNSLTVMCTPKAKIKNSATDTYLGVIKIG